MTKQGKGGKRSALSEFEIIARYFAPLATDPAALSLLDDTAVLPVPEGQELIATTDTVIEGVHFRGDDPPDSIGHKALAVTLSDLAAKGARPYAYLLSLALPDASAPWLEAFAQGLGALQAEAGICLVGGDTSATPGPVTITITALGLLSQGDAVLRRGALPGDALMVSGTIGDAYLGLCLLREPRLAGDWHLSEDEAAFLVERYRRPQARTGLAPSVRHYARASIDVSDGLAADAQKLCKASGVASTIEAARVPLSPAAAKAVQASPQLFKAMISGGDDYEILTAMEPSHASAFAREAIEHSIPVTVIGSIRQGAGEVDVLDAAGKPVPLDQLGFVHFRDD
jgi:thiamine-monophosphate kinase